MMDGGKLVVEKARESDSDRGTWIKEMGREGGRKGGKGNEPSSPMRAVRPLIPILSSRLRVVYEEKRW